MNRRNHTAKFYTSSLSLVLFVLIFVAIGTKLIFFSHAATSCTTTVSSTSALASAVSSASDGDTVCLSAGTYGSVTLARSGSHASNVTVEPDPTLDPNGAGKVTLGAITVSGSYITVHNLYATGGIVISGNNDTIDHNDVTNTPGGYGITVSGTSSSPATNVMVSGNKVHGMTGTNGVVSGSGCSSYGDDGDVLRLGPFNNVTFTGNDLYNNSDAANANACAGHSDTLQSYLGGSLTATGLTVTNNYVHDETNVQGLPFLKDNDIQNVNVSDNLSVRLSSDGQTNGPGIDENSSVNSSVSSPPAYGIIIEKNTYYNSGGYLSAAGSLSNPTATFDHNFINTFNTQGTSYSTFVHKYNDYQNGQPTEFTYSLDSTEKLLSGDPAFKCSTAGSGGTSICGNGTATGDDYELASNPNGIGIDWSPASQTYGPINTSGSSGTTNAYDLNSDGKVDSSDLTIFQGHWNSTGTGLPEDFNNDGAVNVFDLSKLLSHYGV